MIKDSKYIKIKRVNCLYLIINKVNGYFDETNSTAQKMNFPLRISSVNLTKSAENYQFPSKANKKFKKYEELWSKIIDLIRSITKNSDDYDKHQI